jgi:hypothetical protein
MESLYELQQVRDLYNAEQKQKLADEHPQVVSAVNEALKAGGRGEDWTLGNAIVYHHPEDGVISAVVMLSMMLTEGPLRGTPVSLRADVRRNGSELIVKFLFSS